jgi:hypothetical protein
MSPGDRVIIKPHLAQQVHPRVPPERRGTITAITRAKQAMVLWDGRRDPEAYHKSLLTVVTSDG